MGKKIEMSAFHHGVVQFMMSTDKMYYAGGDSIDFVIFKELINPFEPNEELTENIVGYEVLDIETIEENDIPDIPEKYDVVWYDLTETGMKDMTIKEIVMAVKTQYLKEHKGQDRQVA
jgi:hypothetical protein